MWIFYYPILSRISNNLHRSEGVLYAFEPYLFSQNFDEDALRAVLLSINVANFPRIYFGQTNVFLMPEKKKRARQDACGCNRFLSRSYRDGSKSRHEGSIRLQSDSTWSGWQCPTCTGRAKENGNTPRSSNLATQPIAYRSHGRRKASCESEKVFCSIKYRRRIRAMLFSVPQKKL